MLGGQERLSGGVGRSVQGQGQWVRSQPGSHVAFLMISVPLSTTGGGRPLRPSWTPRIPWGPRSTGKRLPQGTSISGNEVSGCGAEAWSLDV